MHVFKRHPSDKQCAIRVVELARNEVIPFKVESIPFREIVNVKVRPGGSYVIEKW